MVTRVPPRVDAVLGVMDVMFGPLSGQASSFMGKGVPASAIGSLQDTGSDVPQTLRVTSYSPDRHHDSKSGVAIQIELAAFHA